MRNRDLRIDSEVRNNNFHLWSTQTCFCKLKVVQKLGQVLFENSFLNSRVEVYSKGNCDMYELKVEKLIPVQKVTPRFDLDLLQWSEDSSATPPKLNPRTLWQLSHTTIPFFFFSCSFILKLSDLDMWFLYHFVQILTTYYFIHKHNQIKNLQKLLLDTKQTDIKMLRFFFFFFFQCFFHIVKAH